MGLGFLFFIMAIICFVLHLAESELIGISGDRWISAGLLCLTIATAWAPGYMYYEKFRANPPG